MVFDAARRGRAANAEEAARYGSYLMLEFGRWVKNLRPKSLN